MQRREFLMTAGSGLTAAALSRSIAAAEPAKTLTVRQAEIDQYVLQFAPSQPRPLRILQLTDTHFGTPDVEAKQKDERSFVTIRQLVGLEKPDFIVHTGDFVNNDKGRGVRFDAVDFFNDLGVPWSLALGNHDIGARPVADIRKQMKHAAFGEFKAAGSTHNAFRLDVVHASRGEPAWSVFCFDSGFQKGAKHVSREQVEWFNRQMRSDADAGLKSPALAMIHIPVLEFEAARAAKKTTGNFGERVSFESDRGDTFGALACCALGPWITLAAAMPAPADITIELAIRRNEQVVFSGSTSVAQMARTFDDLIGWLGRDNSFPQGVILLTGTGVVPGDDFTLAVGDEVGISISGIGRLVNRVVQASAG